MERKMIIQTLISRIIGCLALTVVLGVSSSITVASETCKVNDSDINKNYTGDCVDGLAQGQGIAKGRDTYEGTFEKGNKHGKGVYTWSNGSKYDGEWKDDQKSGYGVSLIAENGKLAHTYKGEFKDGKMSGFGVLQRIKDGKMARGLWENGKIKLSCSSKSSCEAQASLDCSRIKNTEELVTCSRMGKYHP